MNRGTTGIAVNFKEETETNNLTLTQETKSKRLERAATTDRVTSITTWHERK